MTKEEILQLIRQGESFRLEAKKAEKEVPVSVWESYSAFCNTDGGIILLGVSEDKKTKELYVSGVEDSGKIIQSFWNQINNKQKVSDNLLFNRQVYALSIEDKDIVVIEVPRADRHYKPVFINDNLFAGTYRRNADGDYHCQREEVKAMLRDQADITLDNTIVENVDWQELDKDTIYRFRMRFRNLKPDHVWNTLDEALEGGISDPRNAILFKMFVLVDIGERIGSGLQNLRYVWEQLGQEQPVLRESFSPDRMRLEIPLDESITNPVTNRFDGHNLSERQEAVLCYCREAHSSREILSYLGVSYQSKNIKQYVSDLVEYGLLIPLIPDKPNHPGQKYVSVG